MNVQVFISPNSTNKIDVNRQLVFNRYNQAPQNVYTQTADVFVKKQMSTPSFKAKTISYQNFLINYVKDKTLQRSMDASHKIYKSMSEDLKDITKKVMLKVSKDEKIEMWDINPKKSKKYVIFLHGLSQNVSSNQELYTKIVKDTDFGVLALDYRGYGKNAKTEKNSDVYMARDVVSATRYLMKKKIPSIGLIGHSFGGYLAAKTTSLSNNIDFQILVSPIESMKCIYRLIKRNPKKYKDEYMLTKLVPKITEAYSDSFKIDEYLKVNDTPTYIVASNSDMYATTQDMKSISAQVNNLLKYVKVKGPHRMEINKINAIVDLLNTIK